MTKKIYKWGIMGLGKIAAKFANDLQHVPRAELYAVASRNEEKAQEFAEKYKATKYFGSYEEMLQDPEVEVIYIATPHVYHYEQTLLCLNHGKAVLCEKPFAMNASQVEEMIETAQHKKLFLMEALWMRFLPHYNYLKELVESKKYGKITKMTAHLGFEAPVLPEKRLYNKKLGGGSLMDVGIYPVFLAGSLLGVPDEISANAKICDTGVDESCEIAFKYKNDAKAYLSSAINKTQPSPAIIEFEEATVKIASRFHETDSLIINAEGKEETLQFKFIPETFGYYFEAIHVQEMLSEGRIESTAMDFKESEKLIRLLDQVREKIGLEYEYS